MFLWEQIIKNTRTVFLCKDLQTQLISDEVSLFTPRYQRVNLNEVFMGVKIKYILESWLIFE